MKRYWLLLGFFFLIIPGVVLIAQDDACPALVEQALQEVGDNCQALQRNSACYGYNQVEASFFMEVAEDFFSAPSDRAELTALQTIRTAPLNVANQQWGIALMSVQANVPNTLPGQAVVFMLIGDVEVNNTVSPDTAFSPADGVPVKTAVAANFRSGPSTNNNVLNNIPANTELLGDGLSADKGWLRVVYDDKVGWVSREVLQPTNDLDALPIISKANQTPMQAFYFTTGIGEPTCNEPPPSLVIQGPRQTKVTFNANGTDFTIGSTIILRQISETEMQLIVVDGTAEFAGLAVGGGFTIFFNIDDEGDIIENSFNGFRPITPQEAEQYKMLEQLDFGGDDEEDRTLNYPIRFPTQQEIAIIQQALGGGGGGVVGNAGPSQVAGVNCSNLRPTSPVGGMPFGPTTFYWNGASGADNYRIRIYGKTGPAATFETSDASTSLNINTASFGGGPEFSWQVEALKGGVVACTSGAAFATQDPPPDDAFASGDEGPNISANWGCGASTGEIDVSWSGFKPGETITITFNDGYGPYTQVHMGSAGATTFYGVYYTVGTLKVIGANSGTVTQPGGFSC